MRGWPRAGGGEPPQRPFEGERLEALWASKSPKATATAKSKILTPRLLGGVEGFKGEDSELPLIPPHLAAHSGQVSLPFEKGESILSFNAIYFLLRNAPGDWPVSRRKLWPSWAAPA